MRMKCVRKLEQTLSEPSGHPVNKKDSQSYTVVIHLSVCVHASCCLILEAVMANWGT